MGKSGVAVFWFRRDLRLEDNTALYKALNGQHPVLPIFIFDPNILGELPGNDARVTFIHQCLENLHRQLAAFKSGLHCLHETPLEAWKKLTDTFQINHVYWNRDYEPYAQKRDQAVFDFLKNKGIPVSGSKDQVIFEKSEVVKADGDPYTVYTPYKNKWLARLKEADTSPQLSTPKNFLEHSGQLPTLRDIGFTPSPIKVPDYSLEGLDTYAQTRDIPAAQGTTQIGPHLRFGTVSIRKILLQAKAHPVFLSELIWREFFMQILYHFPKVVFDNFRSKYDNIPWRNNKADFESWCVGKTGYPLVDAGMRELNATGFMHNRVRMLTASFLCKHLLIDWRWGEAYFAQKLLDYELASNNGNWQWAAGTGCDAAPYFRIFNPVTQLKKFDPDKAYINRWVPEWETSDYPEPIIEHKLGRERALKAYKMVLEK